MERNLGPDLPNLRVAEWADAKALLVADVDQGGALGALYGTWTLLGEHRKRLIGFAFNKFRGDLELLKPAYALLRDWTGLPVLGTLPLLPLALPEEDGFRYRQPAGNGPKVADMTVAGSKGMLWQPPVPPLHAPRPRPASACRGRPARWSARP